MHYNDEMLLPIFVTGTPRRGKSVIAEKKEV
jgi:adenosyl cobinamide kinase/adenosyl cobinamide phosphate guanylyltransferase